MQIVINILVPPPSDDYDTTSAVAIMLSKVPAKLSRQLARKSGCLCTAPEEDDVIRDSNGNIVGTLEVRQ